jgi:hypothetical protein
MEESPCSKVYRPAGSQEFPRILWNPKLHYCIHKRSQPVPNQSMPPHPTSWRYILILSRLRPGLVSGLFPRVSYSKSCMNLSSPISVTFPAYLILDLITRIVFGEDYSWWNSSLCSLFHSPGTWTFLGPNILHSTLFSYTFILWSSLNVREQDRPHTKQQAKLQFHVSLRFCIANWKTKYSALNEGKHFLTSVCSNFFMNGFWFDMVDPNYLKCSTLSKDLLHVFMLWYCPPICSSAMTVYLVISAYTSRLICLLMNAKASVFFRVAYLLPIQHINFVSWNHYLVCTIQFQALVVCQNLPNGTL